MPGRANRAFLAAWIPLLLAIGAGPAWSQSETAGQNLSLRSLLTEFVAQGITLAPPASGFDHSAHFTAANSPQFQALSRVNDEIGRQISSVPLPSSAGGFAYQFDPALGTFSRPTRSFGPIYAERPLTVGVGKFNIGVNFTSYSFDRLDNLRLRDGDIQLIFTHEDTDSSGGDTTYWFEGDLIRADLSLSIKTNITALVATYGVTDALDVGLAVPVVTVDIQAASNATILRLATGEGSDIHVFPNGTDHQTFSRVGTASGLGDLVMRAKYRLVSSGPLLFGISADLHLPTGDQDNLLGTGAVQFLSGFIASYNSPDVSPHIGLGYTAAGKGLPDEAAYSAGIDAAVDPRLTVAVDFLGRWSNQGRKVYLNPETYTYNTQPTGTPSLHQATFDRLDLATGQKVTSISGAAGVKINVYGNLLLSLSGLFPVTKTGLRDDFTPLIGLDYSF